MSKNWLSMGGAVSPRSARPKKSKNQRYMVNTVIETCVLSLEAFMSMGSAHIPTEEAQNRSAQSVNYNKQSRCTGEILNFFQ